MVLTPSDVQAIAQALASLQGGKIPPYMLASQLAVNVNAAVGSNAGWTELVPANPNRVWLWIFSTNGASMLVWPLVVADPSAGFQIAGSVQRFQVSVHDDGVMPQLAWQWFDNVATQVVGWVEIVWHPPE